MGDPASCEWAGGWDHLPFSALMEAILSPSSPQNWAVGSGHPETQSVSPDPDKKTSIAWRTYNTHTQAHTYSHTSTHALHACTHACMHTCACMHMHTYIHMHMCTHVHACTHLHIHAHTHTCIHTHSCIRSCTLTHACAHVLTHSQTLRKHMVKPTEPCGSLGLGSSPPQEAPPTAVLGGGQLGVLSVTWGMQSDHPLPLLLSPISLTLRPHITSPLRGQCQAWALLPSQVPGAQWGAGT